MIPCKNCLILPICRHKYYHVILEGCSDVKEYLLSNDLIITNVKLHRKRVKEFEKYIKPTKWRVGGETQMGYELFDVNERSKYDSM